MVWRGVVDVGIRVRPLEVEVPEGDPFKDDLLGRREPVEVLTSVVGSVEGPCVLAVEAAWGAGKTTFLRMWAQYLRGQGFPVVEFNAWETDFAGEPFVALSAEISSGLEEQAEGSQDQILTALREASVKVVRALPGALLRIGVSATPMVGDRVAEEFKLLADSLAEESVSGYQEEKDALNSFRGLLCSAALSLADSRDGKPLVVVVDELDRCRPSYAVELLEVLKHLFSVDRVVFVLAVNRSELTHSVKVLYGDDFDAEGYLRRFFDVDFRLPLPDRDQFINEMIAATQVNDYFLRTEVRKHRESPQVLENMLRGFFQDPGLSLRDIAQAFHHLGLVLVSLRSDQQPFVLSAVVALILRTIDPTLYQRFIHGEASDVEVVDKLFARPGLRALRDQQEPSVAETVDRFEATIIAAAREIRPLDPWGRPFDQGPRRSVDSPLLERYRELVDDEQQDDQQRMRAECVIEIARSIAGTVGFKLSVRRLELLSGDLISDPEGEHPRSPGGPPQNVPTLPEISQKLSLESKGISAQGFKDTAGFVVLAGSQAVKEGVPSIPGSASQLRRDLIAQGVLEDNGTVYRLTQDHTFTSPSAASDVLLGHSGSGPTAWKDATGRTLKEIQETATNTTTAS